MVMCVLVVAVVGSPSVGGRTKVAAQAVLSGAAQEGAQTAVVELADAPPEAVSAALDRADAVVFGSPVYRADITAQSKALLDRTQRGMWGEETAPLQGKACVTVLTGATDHHFLAADKVRGILAGFFAMQLVSPGLYFPGAQFVDDGQALAEDAQRAAEAHGRALVELATAIQSSKWLKGLRPLV
jgi:FMN reductase